jgi:sugar-specific transcriptional regulator TrmB
MHPFWEFGRIYKSVSYPNILFTLVEETDTHVGFLRSDDIKHFVPKDNRDIWMYRDMSKELKRDIRKELVVELSKEIYEGVPEDIVITPDRRKAQRGE